METDNDTILLQSLSQSGVDSNSNNNSDGSDTKTAPIAKTITTTKNSATSTVTVRRGNGSIQNPSHTNLSPRSPLSNGSGVSPISSISSLGVSGPSSAASKALTIALPLDDPSATTSDRPTNVVQNFLIEQENMQQPSPITLQVALQNLLYILIWYFFSTTLSLYNKYLMKTVKMACFVSALHSGMHFMITFWLMQGGCRWFYKRPEGKPVPTQNYLTRVVPTAITSALEICMANASLIFITLSFYTMVKSSTPIWVLVFAFIFGLEQIRLSLIAIITLISVGVILTVAGETKFNIIGFCLVLSAAVVSGLRWSLTQMLLQREEGMSHPIATLYYISPIMFCTMIILSFVFENPIGEFSTSEYFQDFETGIKTFALMLVGGLLAFFMNVAEFALIKNTSTVTLSVAGISKEILIISLSVVIYKDDLTTVNLLGLFISISGIAMYNYYKIRKSNYDRKGKYQQLPSPYKNDSSD